MTTKNDPNETTSDKAKAGADTAGNKIKDAASTAGKKLKHAGEAIKKAGRDLKRKLDK